MRPCKIIVACLFLLVSLQFCAAQGTSSGSPSEATSSARFQPQSHKFQWRGALAQSATFLGILHVSNLSEYAVPHDHFFRRYADSIQAYRWDTWFDGNTGITNNLGHPVMGAIAGSIELQNDPSGRKVQMSNTRAYWNSRLRALAWATAFSVQWEIGPLSESSLGNYGIDHHTWVSHGRVVNGTGLSDMVMTPVGGLGLIIAEDAVDKWMLPHAGCNMSKKRKWAWAALTPARSGANLLRLKKPWYRDSVGTNCSPRAIEAAN